MAHVKILTPEKQKFRCPICGHIVFSWAKRVTCKRHQPACEMRHVPGGLSRREIRGARKIKSRVSISMVRDDNRPVFSRNSPIILGGATETNRRRH